MFIWTQTKKEKKRSQGKFGTAKQADIHYLHKHNFIIPYSKTQPNWIAIAKKNKKYVGIEKLSRFRHTMVIAPSRQGKGVAIAIPRILDSIDSCFILDLKSELFQTTYEESIRKGKIPIALDPYKVLDRYGDFPNEHIIRHMNPLNPRFIDVNDIFIRDEYIDSLVNALTCDAKYENEHFKDTAEAIFGALLEMYILQKGNLVELFDKFNSSDYEQIVHILEDIYDTTGSRRAIGAKGLLQKVDKKEGGGFLSTTFRSFDYILSNVWASFFSEDGFDFGELIDKKVDLYFIIPTRMAKQHSKVVRLMLNMFMINFELSNPIKLADRKFEVFIDEAGQIKCTREIENILEIYGEKGMCLTTFWQNLNQIKNCFERPDLITEADIIHIFGITSPESIKWIQDRAGQQTVDNESYNKNKSDSTGSKMNSSKSNSSGTTVSQTGVALYHSNEISEMTFDKQLIFLKGYRSFIADKIFYYNDPRYKGLFGINYVESKKDISRQIEQTISRSKVRFE
jgi:type IV secretory pathway TraG/TraD family ATPase VirD4